MRPARYDDSEGSFTLYVPQDWDAERDEEGGLLVSSDEGNGLLHLIPFGRESGDHVDPAEELYAFLEDQEIELEEDEVEVLDLPAGGLLAVCEYVAEDGDESVYWIMAVAAAPSRLVFASYSCPEGEEEGERAAVRDILTSLDLDVED